MGAPARSPPDVSDFSAEALTHRFPTRRPRPSPGFGRGQPHWPSSGPLPRLMTPLQFMARLAALVPPPRIPLVRYSGVLAPASKWRAELEPDAEPTPRTERPSPATGTSRALENTRSSHDKFAGRTTTSYIDWATLMKHGMGIDVLSCPRSASRWKPIGLITEPEGFEKLLVHLNLPLDPSNCTTALRSCTT